MSRTGGHDVAVDMSDCGISVMSQTYPVCKHRFSALPINKILSVEAQIGLLWNSFCSSSYPGVGRFMGKTPQGWIQIGESCTRGVAGILLRLKPLQDSHATPQRDSPILIQPLGDFRYIITWNPQQMLLIFCDIDTALYNDFNWLQCSMM